MEHQDWNTTVLTKKLSTNDKIIKGILKKDIVEKKDACKNKQNITNDIDPKKLEENEIGTLPTPGMNLCKQISTARVDKKISQKDLDKKCNFVSGTVQKYENGTAIYHQHEIDKMSKMLGVTLKKNIK
jgi:ribosome-binding protein aMBF1 (putative translation factor)